MKPSRFHGELAPVVSGREDGVLPHLDVLWHYECVVSPRSPAVSAVSDASKLHAGALSPRSPLQATGLLSPSSSASSLSPISPRSPTLSPVSHASKLHAGALSPRSPLPATGLLSPSPASSLQSASSPISPRSPTATSVPTAASCITIATSPCLRGAIDSSSPSAMDTSSISPQFGAQDHRHFDLQRVFSTFDEDGDGHVSIDELCGIFDKLGIPKSHESMQSLLAGLPRLHISSHVDEEEFCLLYDSVCSHVDKLDADASSSNDMDDDVDQDLRAAFDVFDLDGNGFISPEELQCVLCSLGFLEARELDACVDMIARVDENGDGHVDFWEFKKLMGLAPSAMILSC